MRFHRFYITAVIHGDTVKIESDELIHQWRNVFRYTVGGQVIVFNGDGYEYFCMISELYNHTASLQIVSRKKSILPSKPVTLAMALVKKDTFEWITEKATELGVTEIIPIIAERSEKKTIRMDRLQKIAIEAAEQSGRGDIPVIREPITLKDFIANSEQYDRKIIFHTLLQDEQNTSVPSSPSKTLLCIGPEGGWSDVEMDSFQAHGFETKSLGKLILRAETAAIAALTLETLTQ